jgi:6-phosphogluconate dehydrogenase (decarboxylating)
MWRKDMRTSEEQENDLRLGSEWDSKYEAMKEAIEDSEKIAIEVQEAIDTAVSDPMYILELTGRFKSSFDDVESRVIAFLEVSQRHFKRIREQFA